MSVRLPTFVRVATFFAAIGATFFIGALPALAKNVDVGITKVASTSTPAPGATVTYTVTMTASSADDADNTQFTDTIPSGMTFVSAAKPAGAAGGTDTSDMLCTVTGGVLTCKLDSDKKLQKSKTIVVSVVMTVNSNDSCSSQIANTATSSTSDTDTNSANNSSTATITVTCPTGTIVIVKDAVPNDAQDFAYTSTIPSHTSFSLDDDSDNTLPSTTTFTSVPTGSYTVTEGAVGGWDLTTLVCTDPTNNSSGNIGTRVATINLAANETVTCTYTNTKRGTIKVLKATSPAGGTGFVFTGDAAGTINDGQNITVSNLVPGTYSSVESTLAGWDLTGLTCDDGASATPSTTNLGTRTATFKLDAGETVTCTFTNTKKGHLIVQKTTVPGGDTTVFTINASGNGTITNGGGGTVTDVLDKDYEVTPGTYSVTETVPAGWDKTGDTCQSKAVAAGQTVTCLLTNTKRGSIKIVKNTVGGDGTFSYTSNFGVSSLTTTSGTTSQTVNNLTPGTGYSISETVPAGWDLTSATCDNGTTDAIQVLAGQTTTCTFTNTKRGHITITKVVVPSTDGTKFDFTGDVSGKLGNNESATKEVPPGTYFSTEDVPDVADGFKLLSIVCTDPTGGSSGDVSIGKATFDVAPGEDVTCVFTNLRESRITITKEAFGGNDKFRVTGDHDLGFVDLTTVNGQANSFFDVFTEVDTTYKFTEGAVTDWKAHNDTCQVTIKPGEDGTCDFKNYKKGTVHVIKDTIGGDDTFTVSGNHDLGTKQIKTTEGLGDSFFDVFTEVTLDDVTITEQLTQEQIDAGWVAGDPCTVSVGPGGTVDCHIKNVKKAKIIIDKTVDGGDGTFKFTVTQIGGGEHGEDKVIATKDITTEHGHSLTNSFFDIFTEVEIPVKVEETGDPDFDLLRITCGNDIPPVTGPPVTPNFVLQPGQVVNCTVENGKRPKLTIIKEVAEPQYGGTKTAGEFQMTLNDRPVPQNQAQNLAPGEYTVGEEADGGYYATFSGACDETDKVTLAYGDEKTCTVTNHDKPGKLTVIKHIKENDFGGGQASDFTIHVKRGAVELVTPFLGDEGGTTVDLPAGDYQVSEVGPNGYTSTLEDDCTGPIANGEPRTCTITNDPVQPRLIIIKNVTIDNGGDAKPGDFTMHVTGNTPSMNDFPGQTDNGTTVLMHTGRYSVGETGGPTGYKPTIGDECEGTLDLGQTATCIIGNDDIQPKLTVIKHVVTDNGGSDVAENFTITVKSGVDGVDTVDTFPGDEKGHEATVTMAGTYQLSESGPKGYKVSYSGDCTGEGDALVTLAPGDVKTCTITNDDISPKLTVIKHVENNGVDTKSAPDFNITIGGSNNVSDSSFPGDEGGTTVTLDAGAPYTVDEDGPVAGYVKSTDGACSGTLALGETKTCTITNTAQVAKIRIEKTTVGGDGSFHFTGLNGNDGVDLTTSTENNHHDVSSFFDVFADGSSYTVTEGAHAGWDVDHQGSCTKTPEAGEELTCSFTNTKQPVTKPQIRIIKHVINNNGGTKTAPQFTMTVTRKDVLGNKILLASGPGSEEGITLTIDAGEFKVGETGAKGYKKTFTGDCKGVIADGEVKTCTITNDDKPPRLTVVKKVVNNDGGMKKSEDFLMHVTGTTVSPTDFPGKDKKGVDVSLNAGPYAVTETGPGGYTSKLSDGCSGIINIGQHQVCRITNDDIRPPKPPKR